MKKLVVTLLAALMLTSCADSKVLVINGQPTKVKPYGWANKAARYNENVVYQVNLGNTIWSIIGVETIVVPVWLTGWQIFEPVRIKSEAESQPLNTSNE